MSNTNLITPATSQPTATPSNRSFAEELNDIASRAQMFTAAASAAIAIVDGGELVTAASCGIHAPDVGTRRPIDSSFTGQCIRTGRVLHCLDAEGDPRVDAAACLALRMRSMVVVPAKAADTVVGVLAVFSSKPKAFSSSHLAVLKTLADIVGEKIRAGAQSQGAVHSICSPEDITATAEPATATPIPPREIKPAPAPPGEVPKKPAATDSPRPRLVTKPPAPAAESFKFSAMGSGPFRSAPEPLEQIKAAKNAAPVVLLPAEDPGGRIAPPVERKARDVEPSGDTGFFMASLQPPEAPSHLWQRPKVVVFAVLGAILVFAIAGGALHSRMTAKAEQPAPEVATPPVLLEPPAAPVITTAPVSVPSSNPTRPKQVASSEGRDTEDQPLTKQEKAPERLVIQSDPSLQQPRAARVVEPEEQAPRLALTSAPSAVILPDHPKAVLPAGPAPKASNLKGSELKYRVAPVYPAVAVRNHVEGTVVVHARITREGTIGEATVVSGQPILRGAALSAIKQWRYSPALLNGEAVESETDISLKFTLQGK